MKLQKETTFDIAALTIILLSMWLLPGFFLTTETGVFEATAFAAFAGGAGQGKNASIYIFDDTDSVTREPGQTIKLFVNYTLNNGTIVTDGDCDIFFVNSSANMTYNATSTYWEYDNSFASAGAYYWSTICNSTNINSYLSVSDNADITPTSNASFSNLEITSLSGQTQTDEDLFFEYDFDYINNYSETSSWQWYKNGVPVNGVSGVDTGFSFNTTSNNSQPVGITYANGYLWVTDKNRRVYKYNLNGTYTGTSFNLNSSGINGLAGIIFVDDYFWILGWTTDKFYKYNLNGTYTGTSFDLAANGNEHSRDIAFVDGYFWISDVGDSLIYKYYYDGTYTGTNINVAPQSITNPTTMTYADGYFWVVQALGNNTVYKYYINGTYANENFDIGPGIDPDGMVYVDGYFWINSYNTKKVHKFYPEIINSSQTSVDDNFTLELTPADGLALGTPQNNTVTIIVAPPEGILTIFDDTLKFTNEMASFFANYTTETGIVLDDSTYSGVCQIKFNISGSWTGFDNMTFNASSDLYEYNRSFSVGIHSFYQIDCNSTHPDSNISALDNYDISPVSLNINSCDNLNFQGTLYNLTSNVSSTSNCFNVTADSITLDCKGYTIDYGTGGVLLGYGIEASNIDTLTIKNCVIKEGVAATNYKHAIRLSNVDNIIITNTNITTRVHYSRGVSLVNTNNTNMSLVDIRTKGNFAYGIYLNLATNNYFKGLKGMNSGSSSAVIYTDGANDFNIFDSYIFDNSTYNINTGVVASGDFNLTNVTFNSVERNIAGITVDTKLNRMWYFNLNVTNTSGDVEVGANVSVYDLNNNLLFSELTDGSGRISQKVLKRYIQNYTNVFYYDTPLKINVTKAGYPSKIVYSGLSTNVDLTIVLGQGSNVNIDSCGDLGIHGANYFLTQNVISGTLFPCFEFVSDDVTLDCQGRTVDFINTLGMVPGIKAFNRRNITVKNCRVLDDYYNTTRPHGIDYANGFYWIVDSELQEVFKFNTDKTYTGTSFDTNISGNSLPLDITYANGYFWITDTLSDEVYRYDDNGTYTATSFDTAASGNTNPRGITFDGTYFYIVDESDSAVYKYTEAGSYAGNFSTSGSGNTDPRGIEYAFGNLFVTDGEGTEIYNYTVDGNYNGIHYDTEDGASGSRYPRGIAFDGTNFRIVDGEAFVAYKYDENLTFISNEHILTAASGNTAERWNKHAIYFHKTQDSTIQNNTILAKSHDSFGIMMSSNISNSIITNNDVDTQYGLGIEIAGLDYMISGGDAPCKNNNITYNKVKGFIYPGITLYSDVTNTLIEGNNITSTQRDSTGILVSWNVNNTKILSNNINTTGYTDAIGIEFRYGVVNSIISYNSIETDGDASYGIYFQNTPSKEDNVNNTIKSNFIKTNDFNAHGVLLDYANDTFFTSNTIITTGQNSHGITFVDSPNTTFSNMTVTTTNNNSYPLFLRDDVVMDDSVLNATYPGVVDVYVDSSASGNYNLTNVSLSSSYFDASANGTLTSLKYFDVNVKNASGIAVQNANVTLKDYIDNILFSELSDANGDISQQLIYEFVHNNSIKEYHYHDLNVTASGYVDYVQSFSSGRSTVLNIILLKESSISACQELNQPSTAYVLSQDVSTASTCFNITADNVVLDCAGYTINYSSAGSLGYGVFAQNKENLTVTNCNIIEGSPTTNNKHAIYFNGVNNAIVFDNIVDTIGSGSNALYLSSGSNNLFYDNKFNAQDSNELAVSSTNNNLFYNNIFNGSGYSVSGSNEFNIAYPTLGTNMLGGNYKAGNYWTTPNSNGFSNTCNDINTNGFCDAALLVGGTSYDYYPIAKPKNSTLIIFDETDALGGGLTIYPNQNTVFFANYTLKNTTVITDVTGDCNITFFDGTSAMVYNANSLYWEYSKSFATFGDYSYNVTCDSTYPNTGLNTFDDITITGTPPPTISSLQIFASSPNNLTSDDIYFNYTFSGTNQSDHSYWQYYINAAPTSGTQVVIASSFDTATSNNNDPYGIAFGEDFLWVVDDNNNTIYKYNLDGSFATNFSTTASNADPYGIAYAYGYLWVTEYDDGAVFKYTTTGSYVDNFSTSANANPIGITFADNHFWINDWLDNTVYQYDNAGVYTGTNFSTQSNNTATRGITFADGHFYIVDNTDDEVYKYTLNGDYVESFDTNNVNNTLPVGIAYANGYFFITDLTGAQVYKYYAESITSAQTNNNDNVTITVTPYDGIVNGSSQSDSLTVTLPGYTPSLTISDSGSSYINLTINFNANYTLTNGTIVDDVSGECNITFFDGTNAMTYNNGNTLWEYSRSFSSANTYDWNVTCNSTHTDSNISTSDSVLVQPLPPPSINNLNIISDSGTNITSDDIYFEYDFDSTFYNVDYSTWQYYINGAPINGTLIVYANNSFDPNNNVSGIYPSGMTSAQGFLWIVDSTVNQEEVYKYTADGEYTGDHFDIQSTGNYQPTGITFGGGYFWITDDNPPGIYKYYPNGTWTGINFNISGSGNTNPRGIVYAQNYLWVINPSTDEVYKYLPNGSYTGTSFDTLASGNGNPWGVVYIDGYLWIVDSFDDLVYKYELDGTFVDSYTTDITANPSAMGIAYIDGYFWITDYGNDNIYKYRSEIVTSPQTSPSDTVKISVLPSNNVQNGTLTNDSLTITSIGEPDTPTPSINSSDGSDFSNQNLNCVAVITDPDGDNLNVSIKWYKNDALNLTVDYNNNYANGTLFNAVLDNANTSEWDKWFCSIRTYDGTMYSVAWSNSSILTIVPTAKGLSNLTIASISGNTSTFDNITFDYLFNSSWDVDASQWQYYINGLPINGTAGVYTGDNFDTSIFGADSVTGITYADGHLWILDTIDNEVYKVQLNGSYTGEHFDTLASGNSPAVGMTFADGYFWIAENGGGVYKYNHDGSFTGDIFSVIGNPKSVTYYDNHLWVVVNEAKVLKYDFDGNYANFNFSLTPANDAPYGITYADEHFWIAQQGGGIYKYNTSGVYTSIYFNISDSGNGAPYDITFGNGQIWVQDWSDAQVYKYYIETIVGAPTNFAGNMTIEVTPSNGYDTAIAQNDTILLIYPPQNISSSNFENSISTNFSDYEYAELVSFNNLTIGTADLAKIIWDGSLIVVNTDLDNAINISNALVSIDSSQLHSSFNSSAIIIFYNVSINEPVILVDGEPCITCNLTGWDGQNATYTVEHFTNYSVVENTTLTIYDQADPQGGGLNLSVGQDVIFFANYTYTNGTVLDDIISNCSIHFAGFNADMNYNSSSLLWEYSKSFSNAGLKSWSVNCSIAYTITASDTVLVNGTEPSINNLAFVGLTIDNVSFEYSFNSPVGTDNNFWQWYKNGVSTNGVEGVYSGTSFSTAGSGANSPRGIVLAEGYLWVTDTQDREVYKYNTNGSYTGVHFDTGLNGNSLPYGITYTNELLWITDAVDSLVYKYYTNGTPAGSFDTSVSGNDNGQGMTFGEGYLWVIDNIDDEVYKYNTDGSYTGFSFDTASSGNANPQGLGYANGYLWATDAADYEVYKYTTAGAYTGVHFDTAGAGNTGTDDIKYANGYFWIVDNVDDRVYKYFAEAFVGSSTTLEYNLTIEITVSDGYSNFTQNSSTQVVFPPVNISASNFENSVSTNFSDYNYAELANISNVVIGEENIAKITWDESLSVVNNDIDSTISISQASIAINISDLHTSFNSSASLTFYNVTIDEPVILVDGKQCTTCNLTGWDGQNATYTVQHFSNYTIVENTTLTIYDQADPQGGGLTVYNYEPLMFFANYTLANATVLSDSIGNCNIIFFDGTNAMLYNNSNYLWYYNRNFSVYGNFTWNVSCNSTYPISDLLVVDTILVLDSTPLINVSDLLATLNIDGSISLDWTLDSQPKVVKYNVYRANTTMSTASDGVLVVANITSSSWNDTTTKVSNITYYYALTGLDSFDRENLSALSNQANATPLTCTNTYDSCGAWSNCASDSQSRTCTRVCYILGQPNSTIEVQSCTSGDGGGGGGGGGSGGGGLGSGDGESQSITFTEVQPGSSTVTFSKASIEVESLEVEIIENKNNVKFTVTKLYEKPASLPEQSDVYSYLRFDHENLENQYIKLAKVRFKVNKEWLVNNSYSAQKVKLYRYSTQWDELKTLMYLQDIEYYYFVAESPGLSYFAVAIKQEAQQESPDVGVELGQDAQKEEPARIFDYTTPPPSKEEASYEWFKVGLFSVLLIIILVASIIYVQAHKHSILVRKAKESVQTKSLSNIRVYVDKLRAKKFSDNFIRKKLLKAGWLKEVIDKVLGKKKK
ncbi:PGF-pre-PGF domain-containing protein [Candidatus Woesearchaeota archaeon]|nr:PGF-pre-PGF domain-containing protein [Candidatus Woesearchaeota archaeon]